MDTQAVHTPTRLIRALIAGGILAGGWFIADLVVTAQPAAAVDLIPGAETPVADLLGTVTETAPVTSGIMPILDPVVTSTDAVLAPLAPVTAPILSPVREATQPVVDTVVSPVLEGTIDVLAPVIAPVVVGLSPIVETVVHAVPTAAVGAVVTADRGLLSGGQSPAFAIALLGALAVGAASIVPALPLAPSRDAPGAPDGTASGATTLLGEALAWMTTPHGTATPATVGARLPHASPVFDSDTTPD